MIGSKVIVGMIDKTIGDPINKNMFLKDNLSSNTRKKEVKSKLNRNM
jgi:hypothetical protein